MRHPPLPGFAPFPDFWKTLPDVRTLPKSALWVLLSLLGHRDYTKQIGRVGNATLCRETRYVERTVQRAMRQLEAVRLIRCWYISTGRGHDRRTTRYYHLAISESAFKQHCLQANGLSYSNKGDISHLSVEHVNKGDKLVPYQMTGMSPLSDIKNVQRKDTTPPLRAHVFKVLKELHDANP